MKDILESNVGKWAIIIYTLFTISTYVTTVMCAKDWCDLVIVWPILPWAFIMVSDFGLAFPWGMYPIFILLNASAVYVLGAGVEWLYYRMQGGNVR